MGPIRGATAKAATAERRREAKSVYGTVARGLVQAILPPRIRHGRCRMVASLVPTRRADGPKDGKNA